MNKLRGGSLLQYITLNNQVRMPQLGLGVYQITDEEVEHVVKHALEVGYRSIDTAQYYENERGVGRAIGDSHVPREEIFLTTKVWNSHQGYEKTLEAFEMSLDKLQTDYIDLYLIHWPTPMFDRYVETYLALEELYRKGRVRAIGVSNFHIEHLERILRECNVVPVVNQVECHPYFQQRELKQFCEKENIFITAWSPLARGKVFSDETIVKLANKYKKTPAQIVLRWHLQENTIVIPKSKTEERIEENFSVFDFELTDEEMQRLAKVDRGLRTGREPNEMDMR